MVTLQEAARPALSAGLALSAALLAGCGGGGGGSPSGSSALGPSNPGQVRIMLADAPLTGVQAVNVTFTKVEGLYDGEADSQAVQGSEKADEGDTNAEQDDKEDANDQWVTLSTTPQTVNLLDYANKPVSDLFRLVEVNAPSGHYKKFRFTVSAVDLVINGSHVTPALGMDRNMVEVKSQCFVDPRGQKLLVLDFDVAGSLQTDGSGFLFTPKLRLRPQEHSGTVTGTVQFQTLTTMDRFEATVELLDAAGQVAAESQVAVKPEAPQTGAQAGFVMHAVPPGSYSLRVLGDDSFQGAVTTVEPVQVTVGQSAQVDAVTLRR